jgi:hypothetical protein
VSRSKENDAGCDGLLAWAAGQDVAEGSTAELTLPPELARASHDGLAHVGRATDGRRFVLVKKSVGWKDNFEGRLCCDAPLRPGELVEPESGAPYVSLAGLGIFEELYVRSREGERRLEVYFDLN